MSLAESAAMSLVNETKGEQMTKVLFRDPSQIYHVAPQLRARPSPRSVRLALPHNCRLLISPRSGRVANPLLSPDVARAVDGVVERSSARVIGLRVR